MAVTHRDVVIALRVLLLESRIGGSVPEAFRLLADGHDVVRCQPVAGEVLPCAGLAGTGPCPFDTGRVDLVVDVRDVDHEPYTARELGVECARRLLVPVVTMPPEPLALAAG